MKKLIRLSMVIVICLMVAPAFWAQDDGSGDAPECDDQCCFGKFIIDIDTCCLSFGPCTDPEPPSSKTVYNNRNEALSTCLRGAGRKLDTCLEKTGVFTPFVDVQLIRDKGKPVISEDTFSATEKFYTLTVVNGTKHGNRISSGWIEINGVRVVKPNDFNMNVETFDVSVLLQSGENHIRSEMRSKPGSFVVMSLIITDAPILPRL